jgi:hypothetical protein
MFGALPNPHSISVNFESVYLLYFNKTHMRKNCITRETKKITKGKIHPNTTDLERILKQHYCPEGIQRNENTITYI